MLNLPDLTLSCFCTVDHAAAAYGFERSKRGINYRNHLVITDRPEFFVTDDGKTTFVYHEPLKSYADGCIMHCTNSWNLVLPHMAQGLLACQHDGFVLDPSLWEDEFLNYGFIGAPMFGHTVGNHGFCIFSREYFHALKALNLPPTLEATYPNDQVICMRHGEEMRRLGCSFAPVDVANRFSQENILPVKGFGYHGRASAQWLKDNGLF